MFRRNGIAPHQHMAAALACDLGQGAGKPDWSRYHPPKEADEILRACPSLMIASSAADLIDPACGGEDSDCFQVAYDIPGHGRVVEAVVSRVRNGISANFYESHMRARDPDCMVIADDRPTDKPTFEQRYGVPFEPLRQQTFDWLKGQPLSMFGFVAGRPGMGLNSLVICPANASFFAFGLALLQGILPYDQIPPDFQPHFIIYVAPTFRHTHFGGKQAVVHKRGDEIYEMFSYNLYPGPSAKKGVYGAMIDWGEHEGWVTTHSAVVRMITPYDNTLTIMHEGASGGGKSEILEQTPREADGRLLLGVNTVTKERQYLEIPRLCDLRPVADDMALCHPSLQDDSGRLVVVDGENAWFVRVNHIDTYGTDVHLERLTSKPPEPLMFLNIDAVPGSTALIWEHIEDAPGKPSSNPRVVLPRRIMPGIINDPVHVDIRSFGVRTPPCTRDNPSYGIIGLFHLLPPALAWLWRLVSPRGYANPSIIGGNGMESEGVGSYWPFAAGRRVDQANLLLEQFQRHDRMRYMLIPNQHIGAWKTGFMPEWIAREYMARRGVARFQPDQLRKARCPLLGYSVRHLHIEGRSLPREFLQVETQPEVGEEAYDYGARQLYDFFRQCLAAYVTRDLAPLGKQIIECCLDNGTVEQYAQLIPGQL